MSARAPNGAATAGKKRAVGGGGLELVEEAYHLLRSASPGDFLLYYVGAVPFVMMAYFFWADMGVAVTARQDLPWLSFATALSYFWMKGWQAAFCRRLWLRLTPASGAAGWRSLAAQVLLHAFTLPALLLGLVFVVPFGWIYAFFHNVAVLGGTRDYGNAPLRGLCAAAGRHTHHAWGQNHVVILVLLVIGQLVWLNIVVTAAVVPLLVSVLFGIPSVFTENTASTLLNSTFLFGTLLVAWLVVSPLVKAVYVLRCFRAEAETTGDDLLSRLRTARDRRLASRSQPVPAAVLVVLAALASAPSSGRSQEPAAVSPPEAGRAEVLDRAIHQTLESRIYEWRLPQGDMSTENEAGLLTRIELWIEKQWEQLQRWWNRLWNKDEPAARPLSDAAPSQVSGQGIAVGLLVVTAGLLVWLAWVALRRYRGPEKHDPGDASLDGVPDLESEDIVASQLPENEWARLAREKFQAGDYRLAVRAWFLATLAHLGERGLVSVARWKSNKDYQKEVRLRARGLGQTLPLDAFEGNLTLFERVWYGRHLLTAEEAEGFQRNHLRLTESDEPA